MITQVDKAVRFLPEEPLPLCSFVPHKFPHPRTDPRGHSYGEDESDLLAIDPEA